MIEIEVDLKHFTDRLTDIQQRQLPFATTKALNALALDVQAAERTHLHDIFQIRREVWASRSIKITHFAKKSEPWATIAVRAPGDGERSDILGKFEDQTSKTPRDGRSIAIPQADQLGRKGTGIIPHRNRPSGLNLHEEGGRIVGDKGVYLIRLPNGRGLIVQRQGRGRGRRGSGLTKADSVVLYWLQPSVRLTPNLRFVLTAEGVVDRMWAGRMTAALDAALASAVSVTIERA